MSGVRVVEEQITIALEKSRSHRRRGIPKAYRRLPNSFLSGESDQQRVQDTWSDFCIAVDSTCRARAGNSRTIRRAVFHANMDNFCKLFSQRTECVKVSNREDQDHKSILLLQRLSPIPEGAMEAVFFRAEVDPPPRVVPPVEAVCVAEVQLSDEHDEINTVATTLPIEPRSLVSSRTPTDIPELSPAIEVDAFTEDGQAVGSLRNIDSFDGTMNSAPVAWVVHSVSSSESRPERSVRQRMEDLESIKIYLTLEEYSRKRQEIIDSI